MLNFLVKVATYLDSKGQYTLAEEVDTLITKLSQDTGLVGARGPLQREKGDSYKESLDSILDKIGIMALNQVVDTSPDAAQSAENMSKAIEQVLEDPMPDNLRPYINQVLSRLNMIASNTDPSNPMRNSWQEVARYAQQAKSVLTQAARGPQAAPSKNVKAPATRKPNALVMRIQNNLGLKPTGIWTSETNKKFIEMMKSQPKYAQYMDGNTFKGDLQLAVRLTDALAELNTPDAPQQNVAAKAPAQPQQQWVSKHFKITPTALKSLYEIEKYWPGTAQKELNDLDEYAERGALGKNKEMNQSMFEEMLAGRARPA